MDEPLPTAHPGAARKEGSSLGLLAICAGLGLATLLALVYVSHQSGESGVDSSGFDSSQVGAGPSAPAPSASGAGGPQSSLGMVKADLPAVFGDKTQSPAGGASGAPATADSVQSAAQSFTQLCRANEARMRAYAEDWTRRSPVLQQYGKDWMSYPDLKKLNDDYMRDHDPVAFLRGLARSDSFPRLLKKYAGDPTILQFAQQGLRQMPADFFNAAVGFINRDNVVKPMADKIVQSVGLPPGAIGLQPGPGSAPAVDAGAVMQSVMSGNPQLKQAADANPDLQKRLQNAGHQ